MAPKITAQIVTAADFEAAMELAASGVMVALDFIGEAPAE